MFKIIFLCLLTINRSFASELKVHYNNFQSTINSSAIEVAYKDTSTDLSLKKKECNAHIIARLLKELNDQSRNLTMEKIEDNPMTVTIDGAKQTIDQRSLKGQFFYNYINVIKKAKIEEMLNCKKH